ncbi:DUF6702 family protein [Pseudoduganella violacea]|uniref:DUF1007 family protein n=1 Tax=Pseudoduganella violacea TaxID=1715466 RepID=A0A7W5B7G3_9BURK|nr:DUF6702 family protein [Pseudoduganella violacea]MBB3117974.1 hypothetical protein [Pseudoduganella violacea]
MPMPVSRLLRATVAAALLCLGAAGHAHNYHMGIADISLNARTGSTEVVHTYTAHDVEALLTNLYQRQFDLGREEDQQAFRRYLDQQFHLSVNGRRLPLQWVGMQLRSDTVTVFQEIEKTALPAGAVLHNAVLSDFLPTQTNTVNIGAASDGRAALTLIFNSQKNEQTLP